MEDIFRNVLLAYQNMQIGSVAAIMKGRLRLVFINLIKASLLSYRDQYLSSSSSLFFLLVLLRRMAGSYVSGMRRSSPSAKPAAIMTTQFAQRQPLNSVTNPPITGPEHVRHWARHMVSDPRT